MPQAVLAGEQPGSSNAYGQGGRGLNPGSCGHVGDRDALFLNVLSLWSVTAYIPDSSATSSPRQLYEHSRVVPNTLTLPGSTTY